MRSFVNTWDIDLDEDQLSSPGHLSTWLHTASLTNGPVTATASDLRRAVTLREAIRSALAANHTRTPLPIDALNVLNDVAARAGLGVAFTADATWALRPATAGVDGALGALIIIVTQAMTDGTWNRLKVCMNDSCRWAFYDASRPQAGKWCSMQICGNRAKQRAWRARRSDNPPAG